MHAIIKSQWCHRFRAMTNIREKITGGEVGLRWMSSLPLCFHLQNWTFFAFMEVGLKSVPHSLLGSVKNNKTTYTSITGTVLRRIFCRNQKAPKHSQQFYMRDFLPIISSAHKFICGEKKMAEPAVQNLSSWNDTLALENFFMCTGQHKMFRVWLGCCWICFILGTPASLMVLRELFRRHRQGTSSDFFMLNLHVTDLIFTFMLLPAVCNITVLKNPTLYSFISFIHSFPMCGRPLLMACICGDCYFAVVHPIMYKTSKNANLIRKAVTLMVWFFVFCFGVLLCTVQSMYTSSLISAPLVLALPVITSCDISMLYSLRKPDPSGNKNIHPRKRQALDTIFNSMVMTFIAYVPPVIIFLCAEVLPLSREMFFCNLSIFGICFYVVGCVTMPLLYLYSIGKMDYFKSCFQKNIR